MVRRILDLVTANWALKLTALALAILLWFSVKAEEGARTNFPSVPLRIDLRQEGWMLAAPPSPENVLVTVEGPFREAPALARERPSVVIPIMQVTDSIMVVTVDRSHVVFREPPTATRLVSVRPTTVTIFLERLVTEQVPVAVTTAGQLPPGLELAGAPAANPSVVQVSGPSGRIARLESLSLLPIDLSRMEGTSRISVGVDTTGLQDLRIFPTRVEVLVPVRPEAPSPSPPDTLPEDSQEDPQVEPEPADTLPETGARGDRG